MNRKDKVQKNVATKREYREFRSRYKKKLKQGKELTPKILSQYNLKNRNKRYRIRYDIKNNNILTYRIEIPEVFSFYENPDGSTQFLRELATRLSKNIDRPVNLFLSHKNTKKIGLAASWEFDGVINWYLKEVSKKYKVKVRLGGEISDNKNVNNFLLSFGIMNQFRINTKKFDQALFDIDYQSKYLGCKINGNSRELFRGGNASTELANYFNTCFLHNGFYIKEEALADLTASLGEIIKNAEEHSGREITDWSVLGFYDKENHNCSFAVINKGQSIYDSISDETSTAKDSINKINKVLTSHKSFIEKQKDKIKRNRYKEAIWTLMALQDGISSKREESGRASTRGQGIMDMLEFIELVNDRSINNTISIVSGYSGIKISNKYPIIKKKVSHECRNEIRRFIILNKRRDLKYPPDRGSYEILRNKFPGTVFTGNFVIDGKYIEQKLKGGKK